MDSMVRVISVHHFAGQNVQTVEQPTACTVAPPNRLLLALTSNCVEVRDIKNESEVLFTFPTVDEVVEILHCINGDYVATLETKFNRQNKETNFVRVYINWDSIAAMQQSKMTSSGVSLGSSECGMVQPMRARIAGRVTPTTNQSELGSLEMIEIPVKKNPNTIACCQVSGNLVILSTKTVNFYQFQVRSHDISKMKFIDFEELNAWVELCFTPTKIEICEDYIACMSKENFHMFKIFKKKDSCNEENEFNLKSLDDGPIDYAKLIKDELSNKSKEKITINLPSILKDNSLIHKNNPFTVFDREIKAELKYSSLSENKYQNYTIKNLIQLKLMPILIENGPKSITEEFKCLILKPLYIDEKLNKFKNMTDIDGKFLKSSYRKCLNSVACVIATQQEGYLYYFDDDDCSFEKDNCIAIYPFTAPVYKLVMEDYFLHALTETGLESYTLRIGHQLCRNFEIVDGINMACPPIHDSICLVGLRPFLGVEQILLADDNLLLLANSDTSPTHSVSSSGSSTASFWTLYNLELPSPKTVFNDVCIVANVHRFTSAQTYCHLVSEAHMILRMALLLKKWSVTEDTVKLIVSVKPNLEDVVETYRTSCAMLGDHFIMCANEEDYTLAIAYYKMAGIFPSEVLKRVKTAQEQSNNLSSKGLIHYLKHVLLEEKCAVDMEKYFASGAKFNFSDVILNLLEGDGYGELPNLILKSKIVREYSTDKLIQILTNKLPDNLTINQTEKHLALAILHLQKCNTEKATQCLEKIPKDELLEAMLDNHHILFDVMNCPRNKFKTVINLSEFSVCVIIFDPELITKVLVCLMVDKKIVSLDKIVNVFLEYLPTSIGSNARTTSIVMQKTLEQYFEYWFALPENKDLDKINKEPGFDEALCLLVRSYLSYIRMMVLKKQETDNSKVEGVTVNRMDLYKRIKERNVYNDIKVITFKDAKRTPLKNRFLFADRRYRYLDLMPPFLYTESIDVYKEYPESDESHLVLKKLQAIMSTTVLPASVLDDITSFLKMDVDFEGKMSLNSLMLSPMDCAVLLLDGPQIAVLAMAIGRFYKAEEWRFLISTLQQRIVNEYIHNKNAESLLKTVLDDVLTVIATTTKLEQLREVLPPRFSAEDDYSEDVEAIINEIQNYEPYITMCKETMHAEQISKLIKTTGQQLLNTLNF